MLYDALPATQLSPACSRALTEGSIDAVTLFSPRSAAAFLRLVQAAGLAPACQAVAVLCLSEAVAAQVSALTWRHIAVAARPEMPALLAQLDALENTAP